jgi:hypothetical protein
VPPPTGPLAAFRELSRRYIDGGGRPRSLTPYELKVFSQNGEDGVIAEILARIGAEAGWFVEFGSGPGAEANCVYLADVLDWSGLFIESGEAHFEALERKYAATPRVRTLQATVMPDNVERLFAEAGVPDEIDVLSIDVDGPDYWIWEALERVRPRLVVIEYNAGLDPQRRLVQPLEAASAGWDGTDYFGASLGALRVLGESKDYRLVHTDLSGSNAFFVLEGLCADMPAPEAVPVRGPNLQYASRAHTPDPQRRPFVDLDSGEQWVPAAPRSGRRGLRLRRSG